MYTTEMPRVRSLCKDQDLVLWDVSCHSYYQPAHDCEPHAIYMLGLDF